MRCRKWFLCRGSQYGQIRAQSQPRIIPRIRLPFRDAWTVPLKAWVFDAGSEMRHLTVVSWNVSCATTFRDGWMPNFAFGTASVCQTEAP